MYWFITYSWKGQGERILAHSVYEGSMADWIYKALDEPESYILLNQVELTKDQYLTLQFSV